MLNYQSVDDLKDLIIYLYENKSDINELILKYPDFFSEVNIPLISKALNNIENWEIIRYFLSKLPSDILSKVILELDDKLIERILDQTKAETILEIIDQLDESEAAEIVEQLPDNLKDKVISKLDPVEYEQIKEYLSYPEESVARLSTKSFLKVYPYYTVGEILEVIRRKAELDELPDFLNYIYVVNTEGILVGVVSLKEIVISKPYLAVKNIMKRNVIKILYNKDKEEIAKILRDYDLLAIPVVDEWDKLLGIVTHDDIVDVIFEEYSEDILKSGAVSAFEESYKNISSWELAFKRSTWLLLLFLASSLTSNVIHHFEDTISKYVQLSFFIPLLIGTGGNAGSQSSVTILRAIALNEIDIKEVFYVLKKEFITSLFLGLQVGFVALIYVLTIGKYFLNVKWEIVPVVVISQFLIVIWATTVGSLLPIIAKKFNIDPAVMSAPFIATFVDATGLIIYFLIAKIILHI
ncbi:MAG: magnesium transporter [bacterium]|nr:magnesium transporter [bacterium]